MDFAARKSRSGVARGLQDEGDLEDRLMAEVARRMQLAHDFFKRHLLMPEGVEHRRAFAPEHFTEIRVAGKIAPQRQHVQEKSDQSFRLHIGPLRDRRADADVRFTAVARQQRLERREREDEKRHAFLARERAYFCGNSGGEIPAAQPAAMALPRGARAICRDRQRRAISAEARAPKCERRGQRGLRGIFPLPQRVIGVLHAQIGQGVFQPGAEGRIECGEFAHKNRARPCIENDVVPGEQQRVIIFPEARERRPPERALGQIERPRGFLLREM